MTDAAFVRARVGAVVLALSVVGLAACGDSTGIEDDWEVIEETTFAPSLGVELDSMYETNTGVYWRDLMAGSGTPAIYGSTPFLTYSTWLANGTLVDGGPLAFPMGFSRVIPGFEEGILNQKAGGTRLVVIPPGRGYGGQAQYDTLGNVLIPSGSVLVFEVTIDSVK
jgi:FKBP-type peptidyl-prolyl cis-trans isomerase